MSKPTPGPWEVHPQARTAVHQPALNCWIPQSEADARLIAASPEMYGALKAVLAFIEGADVPEPFGLVRAAIAKAEAA